jgi:LAO/AO transport system kinase
LNSSRLQIDEYKKGILAGDRVILAKAITLVESRLPEDQRFAGEILDAVISQTGNSLRIGITGSPGVGKSTFIESFGNLLTQSGKKIAVLTVDPTSQLSSGSILGDKTRMEELGKNPMAYIRPTPSGLALGGVADHTRETILLCEAAGFEIIIVETVGVGQSEYAIRKMVDFFLLLMLPGSGDELQGIKKGIVEMADAIAITKADGENMKPATQALADFKHAIHLLPAQRSGWIPKVVPCSAKEFSGIREIWTIIQKFRDQLSGSGHFHANRQEQKTFWFEERFQYLLTIDYKLFPDVERERSRLQALVHSEKISPGKAAQELLDIYHDAVSSKRQAGSQ